jgi:hypothetical protein
MAAAVIAPLLAEIPVGVRNVTTATVDTAGNITAPATLIGGKPHGPRFIQEPLLNAFFFYQVIIGSFFEKVNGRFNIFLFRNCPFQLYLPCIY